MRSCLLCDSEYDGDPRSRYCSNECRAETGRRRAAEWYDRHRFDPDLRERTRVSSRAHYERVLADESMKAARLSATAAWRLANQGRIRESHRSWVKRNPDAKRAKDHRRRARLMGAFVEDVPPAVIWDRDKGTCGICSSTIDPALSWPHKLCMTLDHIVPLARGGTHEISNVQLAHAVCNSRKSDRTT